MRLLGSLVLVASLLAGCGRLPGLAPRSTAVTSAQLRQAAYDPSRVVVRFRSHGGQKAAAALARRVGLGVASTLSALDAAVLVAPAGQNATAKLSALRQDAGVAYAEPDYVLHAGKPRVHALPAAMRQLLDLGDPYRDRQWALAKLEIEKAWQITRGRPDVVVAILDTGIDLQHPDLRTNLVPGTTTFPEQGGPIDLNGHGTHVAGIVAGVADNGVGIAGVAPGCKLMPVKVMGPTGPDGKVENVAAGLVWAVDHGARVINMSLGNEGTSNLLRDAIAYAASKDVVLVAASGNQEQPDQSTHTMDYPAGYADVMAVGATDSDDQLADFSFWGNWLSVVAPGVNILSSVPAHGDEDLGEGEYASEDGTSMASPYVAGVAALVRSLHPDWTARQVRERIESTAVDLGAPGYDDHFGHGRVDAFRALAGA